MNEVLAGLVCGYALAIIVTPFAAFALVRARTNSARLQQLMPEGTSLIAVSVILHGFAFLTMTALGILLGLILNGIESSNPAGGLGSPNAVYTGFVLAASAVAVVPLALVVSRLRLPLLAGGLLFAGLFGWFMPYLSLWGPN